MLRLEWQTKYHNLDEYLEKFAVFQKENAPNSWQNDVHYLKVYGFHFFLTESSINNINQWYLKFDEFKAWLKIVKPLKYNKKVLSLNTQQKVIKALNRFLDFAYQKNWIDHPRKCVGFSRDETSVVTADDIFREDEIETIYQALQTVRPASADLFWVSIHTGLRANEAIGLCLDFILQGEIDGAASRHVHDALTMHGLGNYHGYIALESQPVKGSVKRTVGAVERKPLKHRKRKGLDSTRIIPIFDAKTWNILADRHEAAGQQLEREKVCGATHLTGMDMLLFQGITQAMFYNDLSAVLKRLHLRHRSPHKTRHTFFTWFYPKVNEDRYLAKMVGGHKDDRDITRYNHVNEEISREQKLKVQKRQKLARV